jgi:hypothetical protein
MPSGFKAGSRSVKYAMALCVIKRFSEVTAAALVNALIIDC